MKTIKEKTIRDIRKPFEQNEDQEVCYKLEKAAK